jgi:hypothetical protein
MNQDQPLRRLLDELQAADAERQREARDTPAYAEALHRVERLTKAVWKEAGDAPAFGATARENAPPDGSTDL